MHILLFTEASSAGVGRHVVDLARGLSRSGHRVHLLYSSKRIDKTFIGQLAGLRELGVTTQETIIDHKPAYTDVRAIRELRDTVRCRGPFDLIHCHSTKAGLIGSASLLGREAPLLYTPHAPMTMKPHLKRVSFAILAAFERSVASFYRGIIAVSDEERTHLRTLKIPRRKVFFVPNGIEADSSNADNQSKRAEFGLASDSICIGFLGRLSAQKNVSLLLRAFALLNASRQLELVIAGDGPLASALQHEARSLNIQDRVRWITGCDSSILSAFDVFALPSAYEGLPYVLLEAMAAALPIVATRVGGTRLLVEEHSNGLSVPTNEAALFAQALQSVIIDPDRRRRMGRCSRERIHDFSIDRMISGTVAVYEELCGKTMSSSSPLLKGHLAAS